MLGLICLFGESGGQVTLPLDTPPERQPLPLFFAAYRRSPPSRGDRT